MAKKVKLGDITVDQFKKSIASGLALETID